MYTHDLVLYAFLIFFALDFIVDRVLAIVNARHTASFRGRMPAELNGLVTAETFEKSIDYTLARSRFGHVVAIFSAGMTLFYLLAGLIVPGLSMVGQVMQEKQIVGELGAGVVALALFAAMQFIVFLPFSIYNTFVLEKRFNFNRTTVVTFVLDRIKGLVLAAVLGLPFLYVVMWLVTRGGEWWWLYAALFVIAVQFVMMVIGPLYIAPLFNKFTPLPDGELKRELEDLAKRCAFAVSGLFVMDGSRRSGHSNAFFAGLGKGRRIVLYDTLVQQLNTRELAAVLAHEIGHYKRRHIPKFLALSCAMTLAGFFVLGQVIDWDPLYQAFGVGLKSPDKGLLIFYMIHSSFIFWVAPLFSALSRKHEYEADAYAREQTAAEPMAGALLKLSEKNLSNYVPHPLYSAWNYSHPTLLERLAALKRP